MIERLAGDDADLIIENRWPQDYDEDKVIASASHHRDVVAVAISVGAQPHLQAARAEATDANAGMLADASATRTAGHLRLADNSTLRHRAIAEHLESFAGTIVSSKNQINGAAQTFTSEWAKAPQLVSVNGWFQHDLNRYRSQLVDNGRATVTAALEALTTAHRECSTALHGALDQ